MTKVIKFRAWNKKWKRMLDDVLANSDIVIWTFDADNSTTEWDYLSDDIKVMQFTGLLDKNGKEIYEGDLINLDDCGNVIYEVIYNEGRFHYALENVNPQKDEWRYSELQENPSQEIKIIGNIYQNPELLEQIK